EFERPQRRKTPWLEIAAGVAAILMGVIAVSFFADSYSAKFRISSNISRVASAPAPSDQPPMPSSLDAAPAAGEADALHKGTSLQTITVDQSGRGKPERTTAAARGEARSKSSANTIVLPPEDGVNFSSKTE